MGVHKQYYKFHHTTPQFIQFFFNICDLDETEVEFHKNISESLSKQNYSTLLFPLYYVKMNEMFLIEIDLFVECFKCAL